MQKQGVVIVLVWQWKLLPVDEIWSAVHRGGARGGRLSVDGACNQEPDGYRGTRHKIYTGSGRQCGVKPYVLCSIICIDLG